MRLTPSLSPLGRRQGNHPGIGAAEFEGATIGAVDGIAWGEAAAGVFACHLAGLDALGLEFAVLGWHHQGAGARHSLLGQASLACCQHDRANEGEPTPYPLAPLD